MTHRTPWNDVDDLLDEALIGSDPRMEAVLVENARQGLPPHEVSPAQGKLLMLLCRLMQARSVLEIGTLGGYSTIWLARGLPAHGRITTLEISSRHAEVARANLRRMGLDARVDVLVGPALETLPELRASAAAPFDLIFIDADKPHYPEYLTWSLKLARQGTLIVADNIIRQGRVLDEVSTDERVVGVRKFLQVLRDEPHLEATGIQTLGRKGWDGFAFALVGSRPRGRGRHGAGRASRLLRSPPVLRLVGGRGWQ